MYKITVNVDGMACGMCEAHVNEAVRKAFDVKKVSSSHSKRQTVIVTENDINDEQLADVIKQAGYTFVSAEKEPYKKKGLFSRK